MSVRETSEQEVKEAGIWEDFPEEPRRSLKVDDLRGILLYFRFLPIPASSLFQTRRFLWIMAHCASSIRDLEKN